MSYVEHGRYGDRPRYTGLDVDEDDPNVFLHWNARGLSEEQIIYFRDRLGYDGVPLERACRAIPGTAIVADLERQTPATVPVTHYYDIERRCRDCDRLFIFFAVEQKRWYEELEFPLEADCVRCYPCRKARQAIEKNRARYGKLLARESPTDEEALEITLLRLALMEVGSFGSKQAHTIRAFLNRHPDHPRGPEIRKRLAALEESWSE